MTMLSLDDATEDGIDIFHTSKYMTINRISRCMEELPIKKCMEELTDTLRYTQINNEKIGKHIEEPPKIQTELSK